MEKGTEKTIWWVLGVCFAPYHHKYNSKASSVKAFSPLPDLVHCIMGIKALVS